MFSLTLQELKKYGDFYQLWGAQQVRRISLRSAIDEGWFENRVSLLHLNRQK